MELKRKRSGSDAPLRSVKCLEHYIEEWELIKEEFLIDCEQVRD
jgi:hypothetical protein